MNNQERPTAQFQYTAEHELLMRGEKPQDVNMEELTMQQLLDGIHEGHYEWFHETENLDMASCESRAKASEKAQHSLNMAEACLREVGLRHPRGVKAR